MKKRFVIFSAIIFTVFTLGFCACDFEGGSANGDTGAENGETQEHVHTYGEEWQNNYEYHWHAPDCGHSVEICDKAQHTFLDGVCVVCRFESYTEALMFAMNDDGASYSVTGVTGIDETNIEIPSVYRDLPVTKIGVNAFRNCENIKTVRIPYGIETIGECAFFGCKAITEIELPETVKTIRRCAFMNCESLISITVPDSVCVLEYSVFANTAFYNLSASWTDGALYVGKHLLCVSSLLSGSFAVRENTLTVAGFAFADCRNITSVSLPNSVKYVGELAFMDCYALKAVYLSDSLEYIGSMAFYGTSINALTLPSSIKHIGELTLISCPSLKKITFLGSEEEWNGIYKETDLTVNGCEIIFAKN